MIALRLFIALLLLFTLGEARTLVIQKSSNNPEDYQRYANSGEQPIKIGVISSSKVIGKYAQSTYNVALATLMSRKFEYYTIKRYDIPDESLQSITKALSEAEQDQIEAILSPLTTLGAKNMIATDTKLPVFIPTIHKRDLPLAPDNFVFGGIDYQKQIEALLPYMGDSIAIFYDNSNVGSQLKTITEELFASRKSKKKRVLNYPVDLKGDNIVSHLSKPASFNKSSIIVHLPVVKSALLSAHMTFTGVKEKNILSTQINIDPTLLTLTQYQDRENMILANSLTEFPSAIYETNALMNNDITVDWILYATSVGADYLSSQLSHTERAYTMRILDSQVIYPVELLCAKEFGFEPLYKD